MLTVIDWPNWEDTGRPLRARLADDRVVEGRLDYEDTGPSGPDEFPLFFIEFRDGERVPFVDVVEWWWL